MDDKRIDEVTKYVRYLLADEDHGAKEFEIWIGGYVVQSLPQRTKNEIFQRMLYNINKDTKAFIISDFGFKFTRNVNGSARKPGIKP